MPGISAVKTGIPFSKKGFNFSSYWKALLAVMPNKPSNAYSLAADTFIGSLVNGGVWIKLDRLFVFAAETNVGGEALIDWIHPTGTPAVLANGAGGSVPTFTANKGFAGNVTNKAYIDSQYNPSTQGSTFTLNTASMGAYINEVNTAGTMSVAGSALGSCYLAPNYVGVLKFALNNAFINPSQTKGGRGLMTVTRQNNTTLRAYVNKTARADYSANSTSIVNGTIKFLDDGQGHYDNSQISFGYCGGLLTSDEIATFSDACENFMNNFIGGISLIGDSTTAAYSTYVSVLSLMTGLDRSVDVATGGETIAQQKTRWLAAAVQPLLYDVTFIHVGINDIDAGTNAPTILASLQDLVTTVRGYVGTTNKIVLCTIMPGKAHYTAGEYAVWQAVNTGIPALINVDAVIDLANSALNDGSDNLAAAYDTGDHLHENDLGRQLIADLYDAQITAFGL